MSHRMLWGVSELLSDLGSEAMRPDQLGEVCVQTLQGQVARTEREGGRGRAGEGGRGEGGREGGRIKRYM